MKKPQFLNAGVIICYLFKWKNKNNKKPRAFICSFSESFGKGVMYFSFNGLKQNSLKIIRPLIHISFDCSSIEKQNNSYKVRHEVAVCKKHYKDSQF